MSQFALVTAHTELDDVLVLADLLGHDVAIDLAEDLVAEALGVLVVEERANVHAEVSRGVAGEVARRQQALVLEADDELEELRRPAQNVLGEDARQVELLGVASRRSALVVQVG